MSTRPRRHSGRHRSNWRRRTTNCRRRWRSPHGSFPSSRRTDPRPPTPSAELETSYEQNDTPVYAVSVKTAGSKVKFGTALSDDEKDHIRENLFSDPELLPLREVTADDCNPLLDEQRDFVQAIITGRPARVPGTAGRDALDAAERILAAIAAGQQGQSLSRAA